MSARVSISPDHLTVNEAAVVSITVEAPPRGVAVGGSLYFPFYMKPWGGLMKGREGDVEGNALVAARRSDGGALEVTHIRINPRFDILSDLKVFVRDAPLAAGESVTVMFGTEAAPVKALRKQVSLAVEAKLDATGDGSYADLVFPRFPVKSERAETLHAVAPSIVGVGEKAHIVIYAEDAARNVCEDYEGELTVSYEVGGKPRAARYAMRALDADADLDRNACEVMFEEAGVYYVTISDRARGMSAVTNPIVVKEDAPRERLWWGEIHVHSHVSDGRGEPRDVYRDAYARGLDFAIIADHHFGRDARGPMRDRLAAQLAARARFDRPGAFATLAGGETHYLAETHLNLYFREPSVDVIDGLLTKLAAAAGTRAGPWGELDEAGLREVARRFWDVLKEDAYARTVLAFFHHTMWVGRMAFVDEHERLIEICSTFGSSETRAQDETTEALRVQADRIAGDPATKFSAREALARGYRLGFVGGSDNHDGQAGLNGLTGVWSRRLEGASVFDAMYERRCYGTNAHRTVIDVEANGGPMGRELGAVEELTFAGTVAGDGELDRVELVANGEITDTFVAAGARTIDISHTLEAPEAGYYYLRVLLKSGDGAFSSPVWVSD